MFIVKTLVLIRLPDLLRPLRLCQQIVLGIKGAKRGPRSPRKASFFPPLHRSKSHSHRLRKETLDRRAAPNQVTRTSNIALIQVPENQLRFQREQTEAG